MSMSDPRHDLRGNLSSANPGANWGTGNIRLWCNTNTTDFTHSDFFICGAQFSTDRGALRWIDHITIGAWTARPYDTGDYHDFLPKISMTVDAFAKSYYSLLLSDFGVQDATNALTTVSGIEYLQSRQDTDLAAASAQHHYKLAGKMVASGIMASVLEPGAKPTLFNSTDPTTVYTQYLCSVPKRKSGMSLVLPILIADIVFLQACWKLVTIITT
nr:hypothetical protein B0A51_03063 [Rachicladosporium sp. CCFEE 5018]